MAKFKRVVNVIPLTRVAPRSPAIFTYLVPLAWQGQIRPGQLVRAPFGPRDVLGVVSSFEMHRLEPETRGLRTIQELVDATPVISAQNLQLANWLAEYYACALGIVIKSMLPRVAARPRPPAMLGFEKFNPDFILTEQQRQAVTQISVAIGTPAKFLLHGVTGSGKTEVYMQVMERLLPSRKQILMLVPEISLTSQAIERFARRFGKEKIGILHSRLLATERYWMWQQIRRGEKQIIIGPRSAIFSPVRDLGLIVIDEEHDSSYKQFDQQPKYHARTVAKKLAEIWNCPLVLGDATPAVETYYQARTGQLKLLTLPHRIKADAGLPKVQIVDMRQEHAASEPYVFSEFLKLAILEQLKAGRQILLFLNRRGAATTVACRDCGFTARCDNCAVNLVWHLGRQKLLCHHCGRSLAMSEVCPQCHSHRIGQFGLGTDGVENQLRTFLASEKNLGKLPAIGRLDSDVTVAPEAAGRIYDDWVKGRLQILIGTQLVSKAWDVSRVGLVGIISADSILNLPDFRSNERTFQVLTQVAGRTGRGTAAGQVILQTYHPDNYAIEAVKTHDYEKFFKAEIGEREKYHYPPFWQLVKLTIRHRDLQLVQKKARAALDTLLEAHLPRAEILGPGPAFLPRLRGQYQYQIILKFASPRTLGPQFLAKLAAMADVDVDPDSLL